MTTTAQLCNAVLAFVLSVPVEETVLEGHMHGQSLMTAWSIKFY